MSLRPLYFSQNLDSAGISSTQGGHQVAQKWMTTRWPFSFVRSIFLPARSKIGSSGAAARKASEPEGDSGGTSERTKMPPTTTRITENATVRRVRVFIVRSGDRLIG